MLAPSFDEPWFRTIGKSIKELINPPKLPPLVLTSKPVPVEEMWGWYHGNETKAGGLSLLIHLGIVALILFIGSLKPVQNLIKEHVVLFAPDLKPYVATVKKDTMHGGGGGGTRSPLDASKGKLPKIAPRQFTPPEVIHPENPKLPMMPTIVAPVEIPNITASNYGDPLSKLNVPSNGTGLGGGIGSGAGGGVGPGKGPGFGPGSGGGFGGGAYRIGGGVSLSSGAS